MKKTLLIAIVAFTTLVAAAASKTGHDFDRLFKDATLRVDIGLCGAPGEEFIRVDSIARWRRWYGRRVNLDRAPFHAALTYALVDAKGDTIYTDSKYLVDLNGSTPQSPALTTFIIPEPRRQATLSVTAWWDDHEGRWHPWRSVETIVDPAKIPPASDKHTGVSWCNFHKGELADNHINIAIVAEGYRKADMPRFCKAAIKLDSVLMAQEAFASRADRINVTFVMLQSEETGVSRPSRNEVYKTALRAEFDTTALDRVIVIRDVRALWDALEGVPAAHVIVLANTEEYGGSGCPGECAVAAGHNPWTLEMAIHEFGHSFANLGDEYEDGYITSYSSEVEPEEPNITTMHDFSGKWQNLIDEGKASLIEGAGYQSKGVWRGCPDCLMRTLSHGSFCPVCTQAIQRVIDFHTLPQPRK